VHERVARGRGNGGETMTGDIRDKLLASEAVQSLQMEARTASAFRIKGWTSEQGAYYTDPSTAKTREIDVVITKTFHDPELSGLHNPVINFRIICECKSLGGYHLVFYQHNQEEDLNLPYFEQTVPRIWLGHDIEESVDLIGDTFLKGMPSRRFSMLRQYLVNRAFPDELSIWGASQLAPPPTDIFASAFRETNSAIVRDESSSVVWKSMLGLFSTYEAMRLREMKRRNEFIVPRYRRNDAGSTEAARSIAVFYDSEGCRVFFAHLVLVLKARLWSIGDGKIREISSCRLNVNNIDFNRHYIDIVNEATIETYAQSTLAHFDDYAKSSREFMSARLRDLGWRCGQESNRLAGILGAKSEKSRRRVSHPRDGDIPTR
jgi:hypothetical protein